MAVEAAPAAEQVHCRLCGLVYSGQAGRLQGSVFVCTPCGNTDRALRRHLGDRDGLPPWSCEDQQQFFRQMKESKGDAKKLDWKTIKAAFTTSLTTSLVNSFSSTVEVEELPLSVWLQRGWDEDLVKAQESVYSDEYKAWVYRVPVRRLTWNRTFSEVAEKVLLKEKEAHKKKGAAKSGDLDLDLPLQNSAGDSKQEDKKSAKAEAAAARKLVLENEKIHAAAAKAMGPLSSAESSLEKALARARAMSVDLRESTVKCAQDTVRELRDSSAACRHAVNQQQRNRAKAEDDQPDKLEALPFDGGALRLLLKKQSEVCKQIKSELPKKEKKSEAPATATAPDAAAARPDGAAPKRRRTTKGA